MGVIAKGKSGRAVNRQDCPCAVRVMADWESFRGSGGSRERRGGPAKSSAQQSKTELLQAIAARRQAQLLRTQNAPSPPLPGPSFCNTPELNLKVKYSCTIDFRLGFRV